MYTTIDQAIISLRKRNRASTYRCRCIPMLATLTENRSVHIAAFRFTIRADYYRFVISRGSLRNVYIYDGLVFSSAYSAQWHHLPPAWFWTTFLYCSSIQKLVPEVSYVLKERSTFFFSDFIWFRKMQK